MGKKKYKIAYLSSRNPENKWSNSGIQYYMLQALRSEGNEVDIFYPSGIISNFILKVLWRVFRFRNLGFTEFNDWKSLMRFYGTYLTIRLFLSFKKYDFVFITRGAHLTPYLKTNLPLVYSSDTTFELMYGEDLNVPKERVIAGHLKEKSALARAKLCIYPSRWAADSAVKHYNAKESNVIVIPSGANFEIDKIPSINELVEIRKQDSVCKILFVGRNWERKGGGIAFDTVKILNQQGMSATLTVVGCKPPFTDYPEWLTVIESLDKNDPNEYEILVNLFINSHIFLLPTRNEPFGLVFAEACAYALPSIGTDVGGVSMSVKEGVNGYLFSLEDSPEKYADTISKLWADSDLYYRFVKNARALFNEELNWNKWGQKVQKNLNNIF